jgi:catechol 2,3-dioxygenase-like lactoylglutathione lyase family enzyme
MTILGKSNLVAFVATQNPTQAKDFYENILGLRLIEDQPFAIVFDANGITLRVAKVEIFTPAFYTVLGWLVKDIVDTATRLNEKGVSFERYAGFDQDELGIWSSPTGAKIVWFKDPDGNILSLTQI